MCDEGSGGLEKGRVGELCKMPLSERQSADAAEGLQSH